VNAVTTLLINKIVDQQKGRKSIAQNIKKYQRAHTI